MIESALISFGVGQVGLWVAVVVLMVRVWRLERWRDAGRR